MKCPVCDNLHTSMVCPACGFDSSKDYGRYPTLGPVGRIPAASAQRKAWRTKDEPKRTAEAARPRAQQPQNREAGDDKASVREAVWMAAQALVLTAYGIWKIFPIGVGVDDPVSVVVDLMILIWLTVKTVRGKRNDDTTVMLLVLSFFLCGISDFIWMGFQYISTYTVPAWVFFVSPLRMVWIWGLIAWDEVREKHGSWKKAAGWIGVLAVLYDPLIIAAVFAVDYLVRLFGLA